MTAPVSHQRDLAHRFERCAELAHAVQARNRVPALLPDLAIRTAKAEPHFGYDPFTDNSW